jgi:hypothetical protein
LKLFLKRIGSKSIEADDTFASSFSVASCELESGALRPKTFSEPTQGSEHSSWAFPLENDDGNSRSTLCLVGPVFYWTAAFPAGVSSSCPNRLDNADRFSYLLFLASLLHTSTFLGIPK